MTNRILVIGATGILGRAVVSEAERSGRNWVAAARSVPIGFSPGERHVTLDIERPEAVLECVRALRPSAIVNCAGLTKRLCADSDRAWLINSAAPRFLAAAATWHDARLVHVSSDCVFSGRRGPYSESSEPDPVDTYGRSKALGENLGPGHLTVRSSFVGPEKRTTNGLLSWILAQGAYAPGYVNHEWSGLTSIALARILLELAERRDVEGILHMGGEAVSKYDLVRMICQEYKRGTQVVPTLAAESVDRRLVSERATQLGICVPPLGAMIREMAGSGLND